MEQNINNSLVAAQGAGTMSAVESEISNGFEAIFTTFATDGSEVKITIKQNDVVESDETTTLWGVVAAANTYNATPSILLDNKTKADVLKKLGTEVYGSAELFIRAFNTATTRLAMLRSFIDWCETNEVDRFAVAQNIVYDGYDMYSRVQNSGVEAVYGELITYYGEPIFELN